MQSKIYTKSNKKNNVNKKIIEVNIPEEESESEEEHNHLPHTSLSHCEVFEDTNNHSNRGWFTQLCFISDDHLKEFHLNQPYCMVFTIMLFILSITLVEILKHTWRTYHNDKREQIIREYEAQNNFRINNEHINRNKFSSVSGFLAWIIEKLKNGIMDGSLFTRTLQMYFPFLHGI